MISRNLLRNASFTMFGILLAACGSQLSMDNYNKLKVGQSYEEVKTIIGEPARCDETIGIRTCVWGDEQKGISIGFAVGQAILLSAKNLK